MVYDVNGNVLVQIDDTLSVEGAAADAKATGDAVGELKSAIEQGIGTDSYMYVEGTTLYMGDNMTETIQIVENGSYNVKRYATAEVNVPVGINPTGTIEITANGTVNVKNYEYAHIDVPTSGGGNVDTTVTYDSTRWSNRGISSSNGTLSGTTSSPRLLFEGNLVRYKSITVPEGFQVAIAAYQQGVKADSFVATYKGFWNGSSYENSYTWFTGTVDLTALTNWNEYVFRILFSRTSGSGTIDTAVGEDVQMVYNLTDKPWVIV